MTPGKESRELLQSRFMDFSYVSIWDFMCQNFVFLYLSAVCAHVGVLRKRAFQLWLTVRE